MEAARKRSHPAHFQFQWANAKAADAYRLDQARALIRSVRIITADDINEGAARAYHSIQDDGCAYRSISEIQSSASLQLALHQAALRDLLAWEKRYRSIAAVCTLVNVARDNLEREIDQMKAKQSPRRAA